MGRRNGCSGKVRHASFNGACVARKRMKHAGLDVYHCGRCGGWHLGTSNKPWKIIARIDQLLSK